MKVFGALTFPLKHPLSVRMDTFPDKTFLVGDARALTEEQKERLIEAMINKFHVTREHIVELMKTGEIPILADNCIVSICDLHVRCML